MNRDDQAEAHQAETERYQMACDAINRCLLAGAKPEDLKTLARECGVNIKHTFIGGEKK